MARKDGGEGAEEAIIAKLCQEPDLLRQFQQICILPARGDR